MNELPKLGSQIEIFSMSLVENMFTISMEVNFSSSATMRLVHGGYAYNVVHLNSL